MPDLNAVLQTNRRATLEFCTEARAVPPSRWATPRAPGKWSPAQVVEHVALAHEMAARAITGRERIPGVPRLLRPLTRRLFFVPTLRKGRFPARSKGPSVLRPSASPGPRDTVVGRLRTALDALEAAARHQEREGQPTFEHAFFGRLAVVDYVTFNELHTRHHATQLG